MMGFPGIGKCLNSLVGYKAFGRFAPKSLEITPPKTNLTPSQSITCQSFSESYRHSLHGKKLPSFASPIKAVVFLTPPRISQIPEDLSADYANCADGSHALRDFIPRKDAENAEFFPSSLQHAGSAMRKRHLRGLRALRGGINLKNMPPQPTTLALCAKLFLYVFPKVFSKTFLTTEITKFFHLRGRRWKRLARKKSQCGHQHSPGPVLPQSPACHAVSLLKAEGFARRTEGSARRLSIGPSPTFSANPNIITNPPHGQTLKDSKVFEWISAPRGLCGFGIPPGWETRPSPWRRVYRMRLSGRRTCPSQDARPIRG